MYDFDDASSEISDASGITDDSTILDLFKLYVDDAVMDLIVHERNEESQFFMVNLEITVCTPRKLSENIFYIISVDIIKPQL